jgi:hypothetical protein
MRSVRKAKYTKVFALDEPGSGSASHSYRITPELEIGNLGEVNFQNGAILESGVNGVMNEDLLAIVIDRLQGFQSGKFACRENAIALTKTQEALMWLEKRTAEREVRGVEGKLIP